MPGLDPATWIPPVLRQIPAFTLARISAKFRMFSHASQLGGSGSHTNSTRPRGRRGEAKQSEHCGPKRGNGAYGGYKWEAKKESNRIRRENAEMTQAALSEALGCEWKDLLGS